MEHITSKNPAEVQNPATKNISTGREDNATRKPRTKTIWSVITPAKLRFVNQVVKSNDAKFQCLDARVRKVESDREKFYIKYLEVVNRLLDSNRYLKDCQRLELDPYIIGTHLVFDGKKVVDEVLAKGVGNDTEKYRILYSEHFLPEEILQLRDRPDGQPAVPAVPVSNPVTE